MKIALHFPDTLGNDPYQLPLWRAAARALGYEITAADADLLVMWGLPRGHRPLLERYRHRQKPVLIIDYPFWNRPPAQRTGREAYKISLNGIHPPDLMRESHGPERYRSSGGPPILPWQLPGGHILVAGMGSKGEDLYGYRESQWDQAAIDILAQHSKLPIVYRIKPSSKRLRKMRHASLDDNRRPINYGGAFALVTHHGNAAVEALAAGVPVFVHDGVALPLAETDLTRIKTPRYPENREAFFWNLAHWQWTPAEIRQGLPIRSLQARGLL